jgi:hypothetical protein
LFHSQEFVLLSWRVYIYLFSLLECPYCSKKIWGLWFCLCGRPLSLVTPLSSSTTDNLCVVVT